jgi:farnesyl-diphosphate farnesyltransferase
VSTPHPLRDAERFCRDILPGVSRTFAISIQLLPGDLGRAVLSAYLLCRIADTIEDDHGLSPERKAELLAQLLLAFDDEARAEAYPQASADVGGSEVYVKLMRHTHLVFRVWRALPPTSAAAVRRWVEEMARGMSAFVLRHPQGIRIATVEEYREYCYYVAGTVGYMLTELWRAHSRSIGSRVHEALWGKARAFGEALQTVNILKDVAVDAEHENSIYIPEQLLREHGSSHATILDPAHETANHTALSELIALAWQDLDEARDYLLTVPRRAWRVRLFCVLPLLYAYATLRELTRSRAMLRPGGTVKITRREVRTLMIAGLLLAGSDSGIRWLVGKVRRAPVGGGPALATT